MSGGQKNRREKMGDEKEGGNRGKEKRKGTEGDKEGGIEGREEETEKEEEVGEE